MPNIASKQLWPPIRTLKPPKPSTTTMPPAPAAPPSLLESSSPQDNMDVDSISVKGHDDNLQPWIFPAEKLHNELNVKFATEIMLDIQLKPTPTQYKHIKYLPTYGSNLPSGIVNLIREHDDKLKPRFRHIEKTFGPDVFSDPKIEAAIAKCEADYGASLQTCLYISDDGLPLVNTYLDLERIVAELEKSLQSYYDSSLTCELEARYSLELRATRTRTPYPNRQYKYYYVNGELYKTTPVVVSERSSEGSKTLSEDPGNNTQDKSTQRRHVPVKLPAIPELTIRERLLEDAFSCRSKSGSSLDILSITAEAAREVQKATGHDTVHMDRMIRDLKRAFKPSILARMASRIEDQACRIHARFGSDFFFSEEGNFKRFLHHWARRYCRVVDLSNDDALQYKMWSRKVGHVLYAFCEYLKASHDALLESHVDERLLGVIDLLAAAKMDCAPAHAKFTVHGGEIRMVDKDRKNSREKIHILMMENERAADKGEKEEKELPLITRKDRELPDDEIDNEIIMQDVYSDDEDSDSDDEMFPPLMDAFREPYLKTKPRNTRSPPCSTPMQSPRSSRVRPSSKESGSSRSGRSIPAFGRMVGQMFIATESPVSSPGGPSTPTPKPRNRAAVHTMQENIIDESPGSVLNSSIEQDESPEGALLHSIEQDDSPSKATEQIKDSPTEKVPGGHSQILETHHQQFESSPTSYIQLGQTSSGGESQTLERQHEQHKSTSAASMQVGRREPGPGLDPSVQVTDASSPSNNDIPKSPIDASISPSAMTPHGSSTSKPTASPIKFIPKNPIHPRDRLNKYLNDHSINIFGSFELTRKPGDSSFAPIQDIEGYLQWLAEARTTQESKQARPTRQSEGDQEKAYQSSRKGKILKKLIDNALTAEFNFPPTEPASVRRVGRPLDVKWSNKPMPVPKALDSWDEWTIEWSNKRAKGFVLSDEVFDTEMKGMFE